MESVLLFFLPYMHAHILPIFRVATFCIKIKSCLLNSGGPKGGGARGGRNETMDDEVKGCDSAANFQR